MALEARSRDLGHRRDCAAADTLPRESTLLRANPPKGGDAESRGYRGRRPPRSPGRQRPTRVDVGGPVCVRIFWGVAMPFAFKLACRLARLKHRTLAGAAAAVAAAVLLSCELPVQVATPNATVSQLIITPHAVTLQLNQDQDFVAVGLSAAGDTTPSTVSWNVTGGTITDMGASNGRHYGKYHGGTCGSFKVAATSHPDRTTDTATVTVAGCVAPVAAVTVSPAAPTVQVGQTAQLTATPQDASGNPLTGRVITWQSSNGAVASVNSSGLVTAVATGSATITATSEGQSGTAVVTVSNVPVASVTVTPASASVQQGATVQLTATPRDANGTALSGRVVTWGSNNTAVATVSGSGLVSGAGAGSATITATSEGQSGTAAITVTAPTGQLAIGDSVQATVSTWVRNIAQPPADPATGTPPSVIGTQPAGARGVVDSGPVLNTTPGGDGEWGAERDGDGDGHRGAGGRGDGDAGLGHRRDRADGAAHRHAPGRERQPLDRPGDQLVVERQHDRHGEQQRAGHGGGGRGGDHHGHERGPERHGEHHRERRAGRVGDGQPGVGERAGGADATAHGDPEGRERHRADGPTGSVVKQQHAGGHGDRHGARDREGRRLGDDHRHERRPERPRGPYGDAVRRGAVRSCVHRPGGEQRLLLRHQLVDAVPDRPGGAVRAGDAVLRQHAPVDRELSRYDEWDGIDER